jgi:hypothetical protein
MTNLFSFLLAINLFALPVAQAKPKTTILRNDDGSVRYMTWFEAMGIEYASGKNGPDICQASGKGRLPTVREMATLAMFQGAKGILEMKQIDPAKEEAGEYFMQGYFLKSAIDPDGKVDQFYYAFRGYKPLPQEDPNNPVGSYFVVSSRDMVHRHNTFYFDPYSGSMEQVAHNLIHEPGLAVLCIER